MRDIFLIHKPWVTEKATRLQPTGQYIFRVKSSATKNEIKKAVEVLYKVKVAAVNTVNAESRAKRFRNVFSAGKQFKKAIVTLQAGEAIDLGR